MNKTKNKPHSARLRFYEELNDFLPHHLKKKRFVYHFNNHPAIKDVIESCGVPHSEVDLIIVNERSVDFSYQLQAGDDVAIYPIFEAIDITPIYHLRSKPLRKIKFILDVHLGKLALYLRLCGFDTVYDTERDDKEIIEQSVSEKRIILTRDVGLLKNKKITHGYFVRQTDPEKQIQEIFDRFDLYKKINPFTRCLECNSKLNQIEKEKILDQLDKKTSKYFKEFFTCPKCHKIFWKGSHYDNMRKFLNRLLLKKK